MEKEAFSLVLESKSIDVEFVKNIHEENGMKCFLQGGIMGHLYRFIHSMAVKVRVNETDLDETGNITDQYLGK